MSVIDGGYTIFARRPNYSRKLLGLAKDYVGSTTHLDLIDDILANRPVNPIRYSSFMPEKLVIMDKSKQRVAREYPEEEKETPAIGQQPESFTETETKKGHCIRCNTEIPFNTLVPLCESCYSLWASIATAFMKRSTVTVVVKRKRK